MDAVSGATERPCPHRSRVVTHEYEDIYGRSTQNAKLFQSVISPKAAVNPRYMTNHSEQYPHKQMYWIEDEEGRRVDEKLTGSKKRSAMELKHVWLISAIKDSEAI
jgi:hypothetical protein